MSDENFAPSFTSLSQPSILMNLLLQGNHRGYLRPSVVNYLNYLTPIINPPSILTVGYLVAQTICPNSLKAKLVYYWWLRVGYIILLYFSFLICKMLVVIRITSMDAKNTRLINTVKVLRNMSQTKKIIQLVEVG